MPHDKDCVSRRTLLHTLAIGAAVAGMEPAGSHAAGAKAHKGIRAIKLFTGPDNASRFQEGTIEEQRTEVQEIRFQESPPHSAFSWHDAPETQYVITLSGRLEFTTRDGERFILNPGDVLVAEDRVGSGHRWRLIDDHPWRRVYVVLKPGAHDIFVPQGMARAPARR